jgi:hypothetical protein
MRLIDDIRRVHKFTQPRLVADSKRAEWKEYGASLWQVLDEEIPVVEIPGVAHYYFEASPRESWNLGRDFPDLTPPWPQIWFEYRMPHVIHSEELGDSTVADLCPNLRTGILVMRVDPKDAVVEGLPLGTKWLLMADFWQDYGLKPDEIQGPHGCHVFAINDAGELIQTPEAYCVITFLEADDKPRIEMARNMVNCIHPALIALSMLPREIPDKRLSCENSARARRLSRAGRKRPAHVALS